MITRKTIRASQLIKGENGQRGYVVETWAGLDKVIPIYRIAIENVDKFARECQEKTMWEEKCDYNWFYTYIFEVEGSREEGMVDIGIMVVCENLRKY